MPAEPFDHAIVAASAFPIHADLDRRGSQHVDSSAIGKLAALVRLKYAWPTLLCQGVFQGFNAQVSGPVIRQPPGETLTAETVGTLLQHPQCNWDRHPWRHHACQPILE